MMLYCFIIVCVFIWSGLLSLCLLVDTCLVHSFCHACVFGVLFKKMTDYLHSFTLQSTPGTILGACHMADHVVLFVLYKYIGTTLVLSVGLGMCSLHMLRHCMTFMIFILTCSL